MKMQLLRAPVAPPETAAPHPLPKTGADGRQPVIRINHPDYPPPGNELITVPALDPLPRTRPEREEQFRRSEQSAPFRLAGREEEQNQSHGGLAQGSIEAAGVDIDVDVGLHHGTILAICGIITDNSFERVFLSHDPEGRLRVDDRWQYDDIIPAGVYWLHMLPLPSPDSRPTGGAPDSHVVAHGRGIGMALDSAPGTDLLQQEEESVASRRAPRMPPPPQPSTRTTAAPRPYPVVANFESWRFPHDRLPASWSTPHEPPTSTQTPSLAHSISQRLRTTQSPSNASCVISAHSIAVEQAHIIPKSCKDWFTQNGMRVYNDPSPQQLGHIDQPRNKIALRSDLHTLFDSRHLVIVPKPVFVQPPVSSAIQLAATPSAASQQSALTVHVLSTPAYELIPLYHNLALQCENPGSGPSQQYPGSREFLFARFAWSIFRLLQGFLDADRWVLVRSRTPCSNSVTASYEYKWANNSTLKTTPSSRSSSKRPASEMAQDEVAGKDEARNRRKRRRVRPAHEMLTTGEELDEDELFQLDRGQYLQYEAMRRRIERDAERETQRQIQQEACIDESDDGKADVNEEIARWRIQTCEFGDVGEMDANLTPDLSFTESLGSNRSSSSLLHPELHDHQDVSNGIAVDYAAGKASRLASANAFPTELS